MKTNKKYEMRKRLVPLITVLSLITALIPIFELPAPAEDEYTAQADGGKDAVKGGKLVMENGIILMLFVLT